MQKIFALEVVEPVSPPPSPSKARFSSPEFKFENASRPKATFAEIKPTLIWHRVLSAVACLNIALWWHFSSVADANNPHIKLSGIYTFVCAYRSLFPRVDLERSVLFDTHFSSVFLGRSAATVAEVSFAMQLAHTLRAIGADFVGVDLLVPMLSLAQVFCWSSVISRSNTGHIFEESLWALAGIIISANLGISYASSKDFVVGLGLLGSVAYVIYMCLVDIPMYIEKRKNENKEERLSFWSGVRHAAKHRTIERTWAHWRKEANWMTPYFVFAVWLSISFMIV